MAELKEKKSDIHWVSPSTLEVEKGFNVRLDYGDLRSLADSILENGVKVPLRVQHVNMKSEEKRIIIDGHRRFKAIQMLIEEGYDEFLVPVMVEPQVVSSEEERTLAMITLNEGKPLTMLEEAEVYKRLVKFKWTPTDIHKKVGKSVTHVNNCLLLTTASKKVKDDIVAGKIAASAVIETLKGAKTPKEAEDLISTTIKNAGSSKVTPKHLKAVTSAAKTKSETRGSKLTLENARGMYETLDNYEGTRKEGSFEVLKAVLDWGSGKINNQEFAQFFFEAE